MLVGVTDHHGTGQDLLLARIVGEVPNLGSRYVLVAVDGPDGSGKTTLAAQLAKELRRQGRNVSSSTPTNS